MEIKIDLPISSFCEDEQTFTSAKQFLKQLELSVHHAQKALETMQEIEGSEVTSVYVSLRVQDVELYDEENRLGNPARAYLEIQSD